MTKRTYTQRSRLQWQAHIEQQAQSGLSIKNYCQQHDLAVSNFYNWRKKLGADEARPSGSERDEPWIAVRPEPSPHSPTSATNSLQEMALTLPGGMQLILRMS